MDETIVIGARLWVFHPGKRVYRRDAAGYACGPPIYHEHFLPGVVTGEDEHAWHVDLGPGRPAAERVRKDTLLGEGPSLRRFQFYTTAGREVAIWLHVHRPLLATRVELCPDAEILRKVAAILNYTPDGDNPPAVASTDLYEETRTEGIPAR